ncbi:hypothetical protein COCNU_01G021660 [Cocos nucifera]|uniref:Nucleotidyl transferase domain-containing protein n=1 Tax=Cocos nucifera TaxID=13894 RepID=A0A8K0HX26_COCNU|nr:hypothetical protein COCNU_01G021660 [Cocos nucifera]
MMSMYLIIYKLPTYGSNHLSLSSWGSSEHVGSPFRKPNWVNELDKKPMLLDLDSVVLALNCTAAAKVSELWISNILLYLIQDVRSHVEEHAHMQLSVLVLASYSSRHWFQTYLIRSSQSNVEYAHRAALRKHFMWSNVAMDVIFGIIMGLVLLANVEAVCFWILMVGRGITDNLLRLGCVWLMGVPAGFKLNTELAELLGMISLNAIQIFSTLCFFLSTYLSYFIKGLALSGIVFGLTISAALCIDMLKLATLHVLTLHWLISFLYSQQIHALASLWRLFRTVSAGKVEIGAFRTYPQGYKPLDEPVSEYQTIPLNKIEDFGVHCKQAAAGMKEGMSFKRNALVAAAKAVSQKFKIKCDETDVEKRLKTLKTRWNKIQRLKCLSGASWDPVARMISLGTSAYQDHVLAHPRDAWLLNNPIDNYDELAIICGDDQANGKFTEDGNPCIGSIDRETEEQHRKNMQGLVDIEQVAKASSNQSVLAIILDDGSETKLYPLTKRISKGAIPIAANYRLIDIVVSNCINSNIIRIYALTQFNSSSLNSHLSRAYSNIGLGKDGFVEILTAYQSPEEQAIPAAAIQATEGNADAVRRWLWLLKDHPVEEFLVLSSHHIYEMDYAKLIKRHRDSRADITVAVSCNRRNNNPSYDFLIQNHRNKFLEVRHAPDKDQDNFAAIGNSTKEEVCGARSMGIYVIKRDIMIKLLEKVLPKANDFRSEVIQGAISMGMKIVNTNGVQECDREEHGYIISGGIVVVLSNAVIPDGSIL